MSFLNADYKPLQPPGGGYMKFAEGKNRVRILASEGDDPPTAIVGMEAWTTDAEGNRKPVRCQAGQKLAGDFDEEPKEFWAMLVWDYQAEQVRILGITQKGIQGEILSLKNDPEWGDLREYDLSIIKTGKGFETRYSVVPKPKSEQTEEIKQAFAEAEINLMALFSGDDPFAPVSGGKKDPF